MAGLQSKSLDSPDETRPIEDGTVEIVHLDGGMVMRTFCQSLIAGRLRPDLTGIGS